MSTLFFIRHGQASFGPCDYDRISATGRLQAQRLAEYLWRPRARFDLLYCGTLARQQETARVLLEVARDQGLPPVAEVVACASLNEYDAEGIVRTLLPPMVSAHPRLHSDVERMFEDVAVFQRIFTAVMLRWVGGEAPLPEGLESWHAFRRRVHARIEAIMSQHGRGKRIAIVTSGGPIAVAAQQALGLSDETTLRLGWQLLNASVTRFQCTQTRLMLSTFNEHGHLEAPASGALLTYR
jgi:broad specificity phosphatase PhoE